MTAMQREPVVYDPFADVPHTARGHLGILFYEATLVVISHLRDRAQAAGMSPSAISEEFPFLDGYLSELMPTLPDHFSWSNIHGWYRNDVERWEKGVDAWLPLRALVDDSGLTRDELLAFILAGLVEEEARFASLFAALQQPSGQRRLTVGLLRELLATRGTAYEANGWGICRRLVDFGLVEVLNLDAPKAEWALRVPAALWSAVRGEQGVEPIARTRLHPPESFVPIEELILPAEQRDRIATLPSLLSGGESRLLVLRGMAGSERVEIIGSVARELGRGLLEVEDAAAGADERWRVLGPLALLTGAMPAFSLELGPGETFPVPPLPGYGGPLGVAMGFEGGLSGSEAEHAFVFTLDPEALPERLRLWEAALEGRPVDSLPKIAEAFSFGGRYIRQAARLAAAHAAADRRDVITVEDVRQSARAINRQQLDAPATRLDASGGWEHLVVHSDTDAGLGHLERRCRHRERLVAALGDGLPGGLNRGVRALFEGPSGTGKTLAARVLANVLALDLYRVDLAAVLDKYVGESQKHLSRVFARAEALGVGLLLDECDALMSRRTDVHTATDRYGNADTGYLLQRLESYTGIVIATTNAAGNIDTAFQRRMDVVVPFHLPDAEQRYLLWRLHLPPGHTVSDAMLEEMAVRHPFTGGQIRNAAIHATVVAFQSNRESVDDTAVVAAVEAEHRKAGASHPRVETQDPASPEHDLAAFLSAIT